MTQTNQRVRIEFGRRWAWPEEIASLGAGSVVAMDAKEDDWVDVYVNGHLRARGEAVVVGGRLGVRVREIVARR